MRVNPSNVKLRNNYGIELKSRGRAQEAKLQFEVIAIINNNKMMMIIVIITTIIIIIIIIIIVK